MRFMVVPEKPSEAMLKAGRGWREWDREDEALSRAYQAMVGACDFVLVPAEPTEKMLLAYWSVTSKDAKAEGINLGKLKWRAMVEAV